MAETQDEKTAPPQYIDVHVVYPPDAADTTMLKFTLEKIGLGRTKAEFEQNIRTAMRAKIVGYLDSRKDLEMVFFAQESMASPEGATFIEYETFKANKCAEVTYHAMPRGEPGKK